ncbi:addiction module toxin, HicA family [Pseudomonas sp. SDI]|uniref:type II toxin-antitoxin system HicA family toxin n=1 Tax=Pseudomonas sp. SDI TaxID=2170734 RepID=UPI000DE697CF|nr:type II toxin-antitoxin system HicA family toxin [Pseudomonas sp. SDI]PWB33321.1 addiction module toxin, HicA family [Pseudomonas sp. SDI]
MRSREVIRMIVAASWYEVACKGSHHQFKHPLRAGRVTVPHPQSDLPIGTVMNIFKQAGLERSGQVH